ncbi:MarR family transcriptional regulator [Hyphomicrobium sp.]|jgi:DNA-binding MarR family transcriptional regulator|uniref:MarR family winged helix-turn-helix transcriptional regulator n=1 Tax=Hyphomicrobium sp. TaxID=82 RepID=UPI002C7D2BD8|nr:MarR family transcriptional regulator [Hyphomicrobium sp.]HVZ03417.1 MarR family transcriptional regulator [Hyphomicrobium sp.]
MSSSLSASELSSHLGFWLRTVSNHVSHTFAAKLARKDVTVAEWVVMRSLYGAEPTLPSRLARLLGMTRGAISKLADRLIAKSLVVRSASVEDGRAQTLTLTAKAKKLVPELAAIADQNDLEFFSCLSQAERENLECLLKRIAERNHVTAIPVD